MTLWHLYSLDFAAWHDTQCKNYRIIKYIHFAFIIHVLLLWLLYFYAVFTLLASYIRLFPGKTCSVTFNTHFVPLHYLCRAGWHTTDRHTQIKTHDRCNLKFVVEGFRRNGVKGWQGLEFWNGSLYF